jgi:hypothetical protein
VTDERLEHEDLVIGRALHALDEIDRDVLDDVEVLEYHEVLSHLPFDEVPPPPALEARVLEAARATRPPQVRSLVSRSRTTRRLIAVGAAAAVAAAVTLVVVNDAGNGSRWGDVEYIRRETRAAVSRLQDTQGSDTFELTGDAGETLARVVVTPEGEGALYGVVLPPRSDRTYWFWLSGSGEARPVHDFATAGMLFEFDGDVTGAFVTAEEPGTTPTEPDDIVAQGRR